VRKRVISGEEIAFFLFGLDIWRRFFFFMNGGNSVCGEGRFSLGVLSKEEGGCFFVGGGNAFALLTIPRIMATS